MVPRVGAVEEPGRGTTAAGGGTHGLGAGAGLHYRAPNASRASPAPLGLPAATAQEGVESLAAAVERLRDAVGIEPSFRTLRIDERAFLDALPQQALNAYGEQCAPANPRMPMLDDMQELMHTAYYDR
ncbi:aldehyde-alcohol dehydrogenase 2 domain protein [Streptomyces ipomoeae 91-03]|uniref:Aldehyde-alcohol dehydrogenase 2 domain protein n=1 Tax=Streptomyces ipomoeae 91-03 TaxID=698759 RepID=L1KLZ4_9ACTN|nr:aldehyde-alcohol dehydrogenase 2 domain protein [Streptomyces ipomoeae 91-03]